MSFSRYVFTALVTPVLLVACVKGTSVKNTSDLTQALAKQGIVIEGQERFSIPLKAGHIDESIALTGQNLRIELLRVEDKRTFKAVLGAGVLLAVAGQKAGGALPGKADMYVSQPFVIIVREEPQAGQVLAAVRKILPNVLVQ